MRRPVLNRLNDPEHKRMTSQASYDSMIRFFQRIAGYVSNGGIWAPIPPRSASDSELLRLARRLRSREVHLTFPMNPDHAALRIEEGVKQRLIVKESVADIHNDWAQQVEFQEKEAKATRERDLHAFHEAKRQAREQGPDSPAAEQFRILQQTRREGEGGRR